MRCPSCDTEVPGRDLVCGECGAFVYRNVPPAPRESEAGNQSDSSRAAVVVPDRPADTAGGSGPPSRTLAHSPSQSDLIDRTTRAPRTGYPPGTGGPDYVYPTLQGWPGLAPEDQQTTFGPYAEAGRGFHPGSVQEGYVPPPPPDGITPSGAPVGILDEHELRRRGRVMGRWSIGLAILSFLIPLVGPVGIVTGYFAWRLGETRLGRIGVLASIAAMVAGVALAMLVAPTGTS